MRSIHILIGALVVLAIAGFFLYFRWSSAIRQPLDFSHSQHVKEQIPCAACHAMDRLEELPRMEKCAECHKETHTSEVQWIRVYRTAPDILFGHSRHANIPCAGCHVDITSAKRWVHETHYKMDFCMDCHAVSGAKNECGTCHKNR